MYAAVLINNTATFVIISDLIKTVSYVLYSYNHKYYITILSINNVTLPMFHKTNMHVP